MMKSQKRRKVPLYRNKKGNKIENFHNKKTEGSETDDEIITKMYKTR